MLSDFSLNLIMQSIMPSNQSGPIHSIPFVGGRMMKHPILDAAALASWIAIRHALKASGNNFGPDGCFLGHAAMLAP